jgi:hypothetical protein
MTTKNELIVELRDLENFLLWIKENHNENWKQYQQGYDNYLKNRGNK